MKKKMAVCVAAILAISNSALFATSVTAVDTGKMSVSSATAKPGDEVTVTVSMDENPGVVGWQVLLDYDKDALEIVETQVQEISGEKVVMGNDRLSWFIDAADNDYTVGSVAEITFKVNKTAKEGEYKVVLTADADELFDNNYENVSFTFESGTITVESDEVSATGLTVSPTSKEVKVGETFSITPTVLPNDATNKNVTYKSSDESVATVDANGEVTAVKEGTASIIATTEDGGYTATCAVTVAHSHKILLVEATKSTCLENGVAAHGYCAGCGTYFETDGKTETTFEALTLPLADHSYTKQDTSDKYLKSAATCTDKAVYYYSCDVCGATSTETFEYGEVDKTNHVGETEVKNAKAATCTEDGYTGDTVCKACGDVIEEGKTIPATDHTYAEEWSSDETDHWRECTVGCGTIIDKSAHTGGEATCVSKAKCEVCGREYGEIDSTNHKNTEVKNAVEATTEAEGYTGDTYCTDCGTLIAKGEAIAKLVDSSSVEDSSSETDTSSVEDSSSVVDTSSAEDSSSETDTSSVEDSSSAADTSSEEDNSSVSDTSSVEDSSSITDSSSISDSSIADSSSLADSSVVDSSLADSSVTDSTGTGSGTTSNNDNSNAATTSSTANVSSTSGASSSKASSASSASNGTATSKSNGSSSTDNPATGTAATATALGVLALGAMSIVVARKKK